MKRIFCLFLCMLVLSGCAGQASQETTQLQTAEETAIPEIQEEKEEDTMLKMMIGDTAVDVIWEENESVDALKELAAGEPLSIRMSMYGGFEQVGPIGTRLPRNDVQTVTDSGDIVLYSGDQIVVFYGSNSWAYTRLGHISDRSQSEMRELLGNGDVVITLTAE